MYNVKILCLVFLVFTIIQEYSCGRYGGGRSGGYSSRSRPSPSYRPSPPRARPSPPPRRYETPARPVTSRPSYSGVSARPSTSRPYMRPSSARPNWGSTARPGFQRTTARSNWGSTRRPNYPGSTPRHNYNTMNQGIPPKPGSNVVGPSYQGPQKVKIVNKYNYHYPGYYSIPTQHYGYPGYFSTPSYYHYGIGDTGSTALGLYLGYSLAKLTTPTYSHYSFYDGYRPRYDHYTVHHYYHNRETVPQQQEIRSNTIVGCVGDSSSICPANTTSLCTSNGALMCVASAVSTVPCSTNQNVNCITSTINCVNKEAPECKNTNQNSTTISIPCVSNANIYGDVKYVNNTILAINATSIGALPTSNSTSSNVTTTTTTNATSIEPLSTFNSTATITTPVGPPVTTVPSITNRRKREVPQNFCVTILALPAKRGDTDGEKFLKDAKYIFNSFLETIWD